MDWNNLSNWSSALREDCFSLNCFVIRIDGANASQVTTSDPGFFNTVDMPAVNASGQSLIFMAVFCDQAGTYLLLADHSRLYWRLLKTQEWEILRLWWDQHRSRYCHEYQVLRQIEEYLLSLPEGSHIFFITRYGRQVKMFKDRSLVVDQGIWQEIGRRGLVLNLLEQAIQFWIVPPNRTHLVSRGLNPSVFYRIITDTPEKRAG